jgi:hypothetical protein
VGALTLLPNYASYASNGKAADTCSIKVCVDVQSDPATGRIIITAKKNPNAPKPTPRPRSTRPHTPRPIPTRVYKPRARPATPRPKPSPTQEISLTDRLIQLIPSSQIHMQPSDLALTGVPVNFWSGASLHFATNVVILGVPVSVSLVPTFLWNFGDGTPAISTTKLGAPYPVRDITHIYARAGRYTATQSISWAGTWAADLQSFPVLGGNIVQSASIQVNVVPGPTKFIH